MAAQQRLTHPIPSAPEAHPRPWVGLAPTIAVLCLIALLAGCARDAAPAADADHQSVTIHGRTFDLELALTDDQRFQGLSDRESIAEDGGMLFVFDGPRVARFVMRRCLVPIDIVFLDPTGRVLRTYAMKTVPYDTPESQLHRYSSVYPAQFAIELKGGTLKGLGLKRGERVDLPISALKRRAE